MLAGDDVLCTVYISVRCTVWFCMYFTERFLIKMKTIVSVTSPCTFVRWHMLDYSHLRKAAIIMDVIHM